MFFVTDVETADTNYFNTGALLTIGSVAVDEESKEKVSYFYEKLDHTQAIKNPDTMKWWSEQSQEAYNEAFDGENRFSHGDAASEFQFWVNSLADKQNAFFAANPAHFNFGWINGLFHSTGIVNPFSHRALCIRSMMYGIKGGKFGEKRGDEFHKPKIPHIAIDDAEAEAKNLIDLLIKE